jgi:SAM-dependent methyltransferase
MSVSDYLVHSIHRESWLFSHKIEKDKPMTAYERFLERYETGRIPWNAELPPPEVIDLVAEMSPGRALDLGCGYGRSTIYLAQKGWQADGIDFVPQAIAEARRRAEAAGVLAQAHFHVGSVGKLDFLEGAYQFALDVGCLHALSEEAMQGYRSGLQRLLEPGAVYLLFAHLRAEDEPIDEDKPRGITEAMVRQLFADGFTLERTELGWTQVEDKPPWQSGWFWWRRVKIHR